MTLRLDKRKKIVRTLAQKQNQIQQRALVNPTNHRKPPSTASPAVSPILYMRPANIERPGLGSNITTTLGFAHDFSRVPVHAEAPMIFQKEPAVDLPRHQYEWAAKRFIDQPEPIIRKPDSKNKQKAGSVVLPRRVSHLQDSVLTRSMSVLGAHASYASESEAGTERAIARAGFAGQPGRFPGTGRINEMLGADFSRVEVHTSPEAKAANEALGSLGYTFQGKVALKDTTLGTQLHEAVHLVQLGYVPARFEVHGGSNRTTLETEASSAKKAALKGKLTFGRNLSRIPETQYARKYVLKDQEFASWISDEERSRLERLEWWMQREFLWGISGGTLRGATRGTATGLSFGEVSVPMPPQQQPQLGRGLTQQEVIALHDTLFNIMVPESHFLAQRYDRETIRQATLGSAVYEAIARMPWERHQDRLSAVAHAWGFREEEASVGPFQAYPIMTARAVTNPRLRAWLEEHGDVEAQLFIRRTSGLTRESEFRARLRGALGTESLLGSASLSLAGKIALTLHAIRELDEANPVMRRLNCAQLLRIWMDYETVHCDHGYYARGDFHRQHLDLQPGEPLDLRSHSTEGFVQRHVMRRLGFVVWNQPQIPNPS